LDEKTNVNNNWLKGMSVFNMAFFLLFFMTSIVAITSLLLLFGMMVTAWTLLFALIFSIGIIYYIRPDIKQTMFIVVVALLIFIAFLYFSGCIYDFSWDGSAYQKTAVGLLKNGYNPVYQASIVFNNITQSIPYNANKTIQWADAYPKASWYFASTIYALTGNIETGKVYTLLSMFIVFGLFYDYLSCKNLKRWQIILISFLAAFNPISFTQYLSYYNDGLVASILICMILLFIAYFDEDYHRSKFEMYAMIACLAIFGCNLKYSVTLFTGFYCIIFFVFILYKNKKHEIKVSCGKLFAFFTGTAIFSIFIVGFAPYITNTMRYKDPLYGFIGDVSKNLVPSGSVLGLNNTENFFASIFGKMSHGEFQTLGTLLKFPFTIHPSELSYYNFSYVDTRMGGFGVWFSGVFILSIIALVVSFIKCIKKMELTHWMATILFIASLLLMMYLPLTSQARYIGQLYILPIYALIILFLINKKSKTLKLRIASQIYALVLAAVMIVNIAPWVIATKDHIKESISTTANFKYLQEYGNKNTTKIALWVSDFSGINYNFKDFNLNFTLIPYDQVDDTYVSTYKGFVYYKIQK
jgi:hypothetical protein